MLDLLVHNATLPDGRQGMGLGITAGKIVAVDAGLTPATTPALETLDAGGLLVSPPFVDAHFHMDATLSYGLPRVNASGTLLEGIALWGELKPLLTQEALIERALAYCDWAVAKGLLAIRSHVDVCDPRLLAVEALLEVKRRVAPYLDLQLVAFPQDGVLRDPQGVEKLKRALAMGVDVVGGIPHFERTMADGALSVKLLCEIAAAEGRMVDMHCDESDDPLSRHIETLAFETQRLGLHLNGYGLEPGCHADFVLLQAQDPIEAIRLRATRLAAYRRGKRLAQTPASTAALFLEGRPGETSLMHRPG